MGSRNVDRVKSFSQAEQLFLATSYRDWYDVLGNPASTSAATRQRLEKYEDLAKLYNTHDATWTHRTVRQLRTKIQNMLTETRKHPYAKPVPTGNLPAPPPPETPWMRVLVEIVKANPVAQPIVIGHETLNEEGPEQLKESTVELDESSEDVAAADRSVVEQDPAANWGDGILDQTPGPSLRQRQATLDSQPGPTPKRRKAPTGCECSSLLELERQRFEINLAHQKETAKVELEFMREKQMKELQLLECKRLSLLSKGQVYRDLSEFISGMRPQPQPQYQDPNGNVYANL